MNIYVINHLVLLHLELRFVIPFYFIFVHRATLSHLLPPLVWWCL